MNITIYHNPNCSKSRKTLELIENYGIHPKIVEYLKEMPNADTILKVAGFLRLAVADILRPAEPDYASLTETIALDDDAALAAGLQNYPRALQRPIVVDETAGKAIIGRPPENVFELLKT